MGSPFFMPSINRRREFNNATLICRVEVKQDMPGLTIRGHGGSE